MDYMPIFEFFFNYLLIGYLKKLKNKNLNNERSNE